MPPRTTFFFSIKNVLTRELAERPARSHRVLSPDGTAFEVKDPRRLEQDILPKYFRHSRFQSLVRQLNFYSFKKISKVCVCIVCARKEQNTPRENGALRAYAVSWGGTNGVPRHLGARSLAADVAAGPGPTGEGVETQPTSLLRR